VAWLGVSKMATIETVNKCFGEYFTAMQFVSKAVAKEETRPVLTHIRIEQTAHDKRFAYAADGYRLHIADISECPPIPEGQYTVIKSTKKELILQKEDNEGTYPNIWELIPNAPCIKEFDNAVGFNCLYAHVIRALSDGVGINHKYLQDIDSDNHDWSMWYGGGSNPIGFKNNTLCAVIMPMAIQSEAHSDYHAPTKHYDRHPRFPSVSNVESDFDDDDTIADDTQEDITTIVDEAESVIAETILDKITVCVG
jgi:hypothetical protein